MAVYALINRIHLIIIIGFYCNIWKMGIKQMTENVSFNSFLHTQSALTPCK